MPIQTSNQTADAFVRMLWDHDADGCHDTAELLDLAATALALALERNGIEPMRAMQAAAIDAQRYQRGMWGPVTPLEWEVA